MKKKKKNRKREKENKPQPACTPFGNTGQGKPLCVHRHTTNSSIWPGCILPRPGAKAGLPRQVDILALSEGVV